MSSSLPNPNAPLVPTPTREVFLLATCLCDAFYADVARATVEVLEHAGCRVHFPEDQTCCGQPAFNSGDFANSRAIARHMMKVFAGDLPIIVPSGSCAAMHRHGHPLQFENEPDLPQARALGERTWEVLSFLYDELGVRSWKGRFEGRVAIHHSCHTRGSGTRPAMRRLLESIPGVEIVEFDQSEQCCGFGGTFSVTFPHISEEMGRAKLDRVLQAKPDYLVSADMSCLMHLSGLAEREGRKLETRHAIQILRDALRNDQGLMPND